MAASDSLPKPGPVDNLRALLKLRSPHPYCEYQVFAFVLNRDIQKNDDLYGMIFPLGGFYTKEEASAHAREVIVKTGHPAVIAARYAVAIPLTTKFQNEVVESVTVDTSGKLVNLQTMQSKKEHEDYEKQLQLEQDITKEAEAENDPDNIEHFKRQCYLAIKNLAAYRKHREDMKLAEANFVKRMEAVKEHHLKHPEHEAKFLPYLKKKLQERGESALYDAIEKGYPEIHDRLRDMLINE